MDQVLLFMLVGFLAQIVDGALGMAYGLIATTVLLTFGVMPASASASVHLAELFTTAASGSAHLAHRNVDFRTLLRLAPAGAIGGMLGVYLITGIDGENIRPFVIAYLAIMGALVLYRGGRPRTACHPSAKATAILGGVAGFSDAIGGGGWGPLVSSTLMARGGAPRYVLGTTNAAEFLVTASISASFIVALMTGRWDDMDTVLDYAGAVVGLIIGGIAAAPVASFVVKRAPARLLAISVGCLLLTLCAFQSWQILS